MVTTSQEVALLDLRKSITFCREIKTPIIGVVENMSGLSCSHCSREIELFKTGGGEQIAGEMKIPFLGRIPLDLELVISSDDGKSFIENHPESVVSKAFANIAENWIKRLENS